MNYSERTANLAGRNLLRSSSPDTIDDDGWNCTSENVIPDGRLVTGQNTAFAKNATEILVEAIGG